MGYEGDTCSFKCNTGYELTGSDTRTCQSNGTWSGTESTCRGMHVCILVRVLLVIKSLLCIMLIAARLCPSLSEPNNGMISCSLGIDGDATYEDTCSFICNTGYELTGSDTRICQSEGSWSGTGGSCRRGTWLCVCTSIIIV